jgi:hypothetical protein
MDSINNGIQVSGGTFHAGNLAVGNDATAVETTYAPALNKETEEVIRAVKATCTPTLDGQVKTVTKPVASSRTKVLVAYDRKDTKWLERLRVHFKPLEQRGMIELWDDSKIAVGTEWREELQAAIQSSTIAVLVVSADFLASDFLTEYELPELLSHAEAEGITIIPIIVAPCLLEGSGIEAFQAINSPSDPLSKMTYSAREQTLVKLVEAVNRRLMQTLPPPA